MARRASLFGEYLEALLIAVLFATFLRTFVVQAFKIPTSSMEANLLVGDHILVNKLIYGGEVTWLPQRPVRRGDVVVFRFPGDPSRDFVKRCVGLPGDTVELVDKALYVNGREVVDDAYTVHRDPQVYPSSQFLREDFQGRDNYGPYTLLDGELFCLGDNRDESNDSRFWGPVPVSYVKGRALMIYWSLDTEVLTAGEPGSEDGGTWDRISDMSKTLVRLFTRSRWERCLRLVR